MAIKSISVIGLERWELHHRFSAQSRVRSERLRRAGKAGDGSDRQGSQIRGFSPECRRRIGSGDPQSPQLGCCSRGRGRQRRRS